MYINLQLQHLSSSNFKLVFKFCKWPYDLGVQFLIMSKFGTVLVSF